MPKYFYMDFEFYETVTVGRSSNSVFIIGENLREQKSFWYLRRLYNFFLKRYWFVSYLISINRKCAKLGLNSIKLTEMMLKRNWDYIVSDINI